MLPWNCLLVSIIMGRLPLNFRLFTRICNARILTSCVSHPIHQQQLVSRHIYYTSNYNHFESWTIFPSFHQCVNNSTKKLKYCTLLTKLACWAPGGKYCARWTAIQTELPETKVRKISWIVMIFISDEQKQLMQSPLRIRHSSRKLPLGLSFEQQQIRCAYIYVGANIILGLMFRW